MVPARGPTHLVCPSRHLVPAQSHVAETQAPLLTDSALRDEDMGASNDSWRRVACWGICGELGEDATCLFATKHPSLGGSRKRQSLSRRCGGWKSELEVSAGSRGSVANFQRPWLVTHNSRPHAVPSLCICAHVSTFLLLVRMPVMLD